MNTSDGFPWTKEDDALLGTDTDRAIARRLGRTSVSVSNRRKKLGIARKQQVADLVSPLDNRLMDVTGSER